MKRTLLALTFVLAMATLAFGQTYTIDKNQHSVEIKGKASDIVTETGDNLVKIFDLSRKDAAQYYSIPVYLDSVAYTATSTSPTVSTYLAHSYDGVTYTNLDTVVFSVSDADTTFVFSDISTGTGVPYLRVTVAGVDSVSVRLNKFFGRFLDK
jgi:hypothetical protein